jgi:Zn-dependent peptidase ImmA (M78 family)
MISPIDPKIAKETVAITEFLSQRFCDNVRTDLAAICQDEGVKIIVDDYGQAFDGMLVWESSRFYIHLNSAKGNTIASARGRFTLAHELGHYFLSSHREGLQSGNIPPHGSNSSLIHTDKLESEADNFSGNLLMPRERLRRITGGRRTFSLEIIKEVARAFDVSLTAALIRFANVGTHDIMIVSSCDNVVQWSFRSEKFPKVPNKFKRGESVPPTTVAGEAFLKSNARYTTIEAVDFEDWFVYKNWKPEWQLYEQCFYSDQYNLVISVVWFK